MSHARTYGLASTTSTVGTTRHSPRAASRNLAIPSSVSGRAESSGSAPGAGRRRSRGGRGRRPSAGRFAEWRRRSSGSSWSGEVPRGLEIDSQEEVAQGYLSIGEDEIRLRLRAGRHLITAKRGHGLTREEVEVPLDHASFDALWPLTEGRRVEKTRSTTQVEGGTLEIDVYTGRSQASSPPRSSSPTPRRPRPSCRRPGSCAS